MDQILELELQRAFSKYNERVASFTRTLQDPQDKTFYADSAMLRAHNLATSAAHTEARNALRQPRHIHALLKGASVACPARESIHSSMVSWHAVAMVGSSLRLTRCAH